MAKLLMNGPSLRGVTADISPEYSDMNSIIVVEDEELILGLMVDVLELYGYEVRPFSSADAAWQFIETCDYPLRLLITDLRMPGAIDGVELVKRVHRVQPEIPVIVVSGFHTASDTISDEKVFWLPKPFTIDQLHAICQQLAPRSIEHDLPG